MKKGVYIRGLTKRSNPYEMADKCAESGITFAAFMTYWQEAEKDKRVNSKILAEDTEIFESHGIDPWVWAYPWCGKEEALLDRLKWAKNECEGRLRGFILDPELGYQGHRVGYEELESRAEYLIDSTLNHMDESMELGITSFGCAHLHKTFPWEEFCSGFGSPQFYKTDRIDRIRRGIQRWKDAGWTELIPSVPAFGPNDESNLVSYLDKIKRAAEEVEIPITGWIFWSYRQISALEWRIIRDL
jgi:hypothetical protein